LEQRSIYLYLPLPSVRLVAERSASQRQIAERWSADAMLHEPIVNGFKLFTELLKMASTG
jgi:hypothetical protein